MTIQELHAIANEVRLKNTTKSITANQICSAFKYAKRSDNVDYYFNEFLKDYNLISDQPLMGGWAHKEILISVKHQITDSNFKLLSLNCGRYKNLINLNIDFSITNKYCAFIGTNGSGKSNILELVSLIFYHAYLGNKCPFDYRLVYAYNGKCIVLKNGDIMPDNKKITEDTLPKKIVASYSGEDTRLWENSYKIMFERFCSKMTSESAGIQPPQMFYINRRQWDIALLTLLYSEDSDVIEFIQSITKSSSIKIEFAFNNSNKHKWDNTLTGSFVNAISKTKYYDVDSFRKAIKDISYIGESSTLFYLLYRATISGGGNTNLISDIKITFGYNNGDARGLSEGEKKMILSNLIMYVLADEESLCLFDEPDSHIHIDKKHNLLKLIESVNRYSLITTHSPTFVNIMNELNIRYISNGKIEDIDKINQIRDLSGGTLTLFDGAFIISSKRIIVTEGSSDIKYIKKAIELLSQEDTKYEQLKSIAFIPMGSASNTESFFNDVIEGLTSNTEKILYLFDYDGEGLKGYNKVETFKLSYKNISNLFYQKDYSQTPPTNDLDTQLTCYVEDLFSVKIYDHLLKNIRSCTCYREFKGLNVNTAKTIKNFIESNYHKVKSDDCMCFKPLLDKLIDQLII